MKNSAAKSKLLLAENLENCISKLKQQIKQMKVGPKSPSMNRKLEFFLFLQVAILSKVEVNIGPNLEEPLATRRLGKTGKVRSGHWR